MTEFTHIGERLREARIASSLSQKQAAKRSGYSERALRDWEKEGTPRLDVIGALAEVYGTHPALIIFSRKDLCKLVADQLPEPVKAFCADLSKIIEAGD